MTLYALYEQQLNLSQELVGKYISNVYYFLEEEDIERLSEQVNNFGDSLMNGIDLEIEDDIYSIGNGFSKEHYGLEIRKTKTSNVEFIDEVKKRVEVHWKIRGYKIKDVKIYWKKNPWCGTIGFYPQDIEIITSNGQILCSSLEINRGKADIEYTDELLVVHNSVNAQLLNLGKYGVGKGRIYCADFSDLIHLKEQ